MRPDYYQLLDVPETADAQTIKAAYRRMAKRYHPDRNVGDEAAEERFKAVSEAYRVLSDAGEREAYDFWLERNRRLSFAPELRDMPHRRVRVSVRHARERREARRRRCGEEDTPHHRIRRMSMVPVMPFARWHIILYAVFVLSIMLPWCWRMMTYNPEVAQVERAERKRDAMREQAATGDAEAQFQYANLLYTGRDGLETDKQEARLWWERAAAQGYLPAILSLERLDAAEISSNKAL